MITRDFPRVNYADENWTVDEVDDEIDTNHCIDELLVTKLAPYGCPTRSLPTLVQGTAFCMYQRKHL